MPYDPNSIWGNTFGSPIGSGTDYVRSVSSIKSYGEIDYDTLNRTRFTEHIEFNGFYSIIKDVMLSRLGAPVIRVELTDHQIYVAIDEAVSRLDYHAPAWCTNYMTFTTSAHINTYELPRFVMNNMQYVVYKKTLLSVAAAQGSLEFDFFVKYFQDNFLFRDFQISDFLLMTMHLEQIRKILSRDGTFDLIDNRYLMIHPVPREAEEVIVQFRALNSDTLHPYFVGWLQRYATAVCKVILGGIRGKYDTLPSPGGGARLNGESLIQEGNQEKQEILEELLMEIEEPPAFTTF